MERNNLSVGGDKGGYMTTVNNCDCEQCVYNDKDGKCLCFYGIEINSVSECNNYEEEDEDFLEVCGGEE